MLVFVLMIENHHDLSFCKIEPPETDELVEQAIQDISAGGMHIPGCPQGYIALWAINFAGKVQMNWTTPSVRRNNVLSK